jgi:rubredoxin
MPEAIPLKFICPECGCTLLEEVMEGVTVFNNMDSLAYNEHGECIKWGDTSHEDGSIARFQCNECGFMLEDDDGFLVKDYEGLIEWLKERDANVVCESCGGLGFFASDRGDKEGLYLEIERCDMCKGDRDDNWATNKAHIMAKCCVKLLEEAEFVLSMYDDHPEEALSSAINIQLRTAITQTKKLMEEADATSGD